jgi:stage II sporulation protein D
LALIKKIIASVVFTFSISVMTLNVFAYSVPDTIRVGLEYKYKEVTSVPISNKEISIGYEKNEEFVSEGIVSAKNSFSVKVPSGTIESFDESFSSFEKANDFAQESEEEYNCDAFAVYKNGEWEVYACDVSDSVGKSVSTSNIVVLYDGNDAVAAFDGTYMQIMAEDNDGIITLSDRSYRDVMEFGRYSGKNITAVNVVDFDHYLYSVVPSEMPSTWHEEAIKAQAVAARSYALTRMGVHSDLGYDVCDGVNCQVYLGYTQERDAVNEAIDDTDGKVALYNGEPINAVFFSSSGGGTDNSENVWTNEVPYLRAVEEINEEKRTWTRTFTAEEIKTMLKNMGVDVGDVKNMEITSVNPYGRVQEVTVTGTSGTHVLKKEECRTFASSSIDGSLLSRMYTINGSTVKTASSSGSTKNAATRAYETYTEVVNGYTLILPKEGTIFFEAIELPSNNSSSSNNDSSNSSNSSSSNNSSSENITASPSGGESDVFVFDGAGSGHGVGMSQYGAKGMAEEGYTYEEILKHYYTDITVE